MQCYSDLKREYTMADYHHNFAKTDMILDQHIVSENLVLSLTLPISYP